MLTIFYSFLILFLCFLWGDFFFPAWINLLFYFLFLCFVFFFGCLLGIHFFSFYLKEYLFHIIFRKFLHSIQYSCLIVVLFCSFSSVDIPVLSFLTLRVFIKFYVIFTNEYNAFIPYVSSTYIIGTIKIVLHSVEKTFIIHGNFALWKQWITNLFIIHE